MGFSTLCDPVSSIRISCVTVPCGIHDQTVHSQLFVFLFFLGKGNKVVLFVHASWIGFVNIYIQSVLLYK